jgi:putative ABC transport system permease protein
MGLDVEGYVEGPGNFAMGDWQVVSDGAIEALGERLVEGRLFTVSDGAGAPHVALVNEAMARRYWPGQSPIGRRIRQGPMTRPWVTVVGVVGDVRHNGIEVAIKEKFYRPHAQFHETAGFVVRNMNLVVKTADDPMALVSSIRAEVRALDPNLPIANIRPMTEVVASAMARPRLAGWVLTLFGVLALLLAAVGLYGVLAYLVSQRTHEIGIRIAVGADAARVRRMVLREGLGLAAAGIALGLVAAAALTRLIETMLHGIDRHDPVTFAIVPVVLVTVALAASWLPARRATRVDPVVALRQT